jgi:hypothetical protein
MRVIVEQLVEQRLAGETEVLGENLPQRHSVHHKSVQLTDALMSVNSSHSSLNSQFSLVVCILRM